MAALLGPRCAICVQPVIDVDRSESAQPRLGSVGQRMQQGGRVRAATKSDAQGAAWRVGQRTTQLLFEWVVHGSLTSAHGLEIMSVTMQRLLVSMAMVVGTRAT